MVAKVNSGKDIRGILNYNENKVMEGVAKCIHENLFGQEVGKLSFNTKLKGFENFMNQNRRATTKAVHISLNFHASEKLSQDTLTGIASTYMDKIGFGNQPYLVYQHFDAAHPHVHIVTTNIQRDGKRIELYNIGKNQSEKARKEIEEDFKHREESKRLLRSKIIA
jgi:type IV secretory pathway VirD2 relaxase